MLSETEVFNSLEKLCIVPVATVNSFTKLLNPIWEESIYIVIYWQTVPLYHNSSVWLETRDPSSRDQNPPNFTQHNPKYIYIYILNESFACYRGTKILLNQFIPGGRIKTYNT